MTYALCCEYNSKPFPWFSIASPRAVPVTCLWALLRTVSQALVRAVVVTGEGLASRSRPLSVSGKGVASLLIYLEQLDSRVLLQEAVTAESRCESGPTFSDCSQSPSHIPCSQSYTAPQLQPSPACCTCLLCWRRAQPVQSPLLSSFLLFQHSLSKMSTKESLPSPAPHSPLSASLDSLLSISWHVCDPREFIYSAIRNPVCYTHSKRCLGLFMILDAVNENKYGSL